MHGPREVLNELKWRHDALAEAEVWYVHRGAPNDTRIVRGGEIVALHHSFLELRSRHGPAMIPYHRVFRIDRGGGPIWERRRPAAEPAPVTDAPAPDQAPESGEFPWE